MPFININLSASIGYKNLVKISTQEYTLVIDMGRRGGNPSNVLCPRFPRNKNEGWFVTLGSVEYGELHALKRVPAKGTTHVTFYTPSNTGNININ